MKRNRIALIISALLALTLVFTGCKGGSNSGEGSAQSSGNTIMGSVSNVYLEKDGETSVDITDKAVLKEIRAALNALRPVDEAAAPEDEEPYVYLEWDDGRENSRYAFVYHMADGSSLVEVSESNSDEEPKYYTGETTYNELAALVDIAQAE